MENRTKKIAICAVFAAIIFVVTAYLPRMPFPGGYIHLGDAFIYLLAGILPLPYAAAGAAVGAAMADALTGYILWAPATLIIKAMMTLTFKSSSYKILTIRNIAASAVAALICTTGYFVYEALLVSNIPAALNSVVFNIVQGGASSFIFIAAAFALDRINFKGRLNIM